MYLSEFPFPTIWEAFLVRNPRGSALPVGGATPVVFDDPVPWLEEYGTVPFGECTIASPSAANSNYPLHAHTLPSNAHSVTGCASNSKVFDMGTQRLGTASSPNSLVFVAGLGSPALMSSNVFRSSSKVPTTFSTKGTSWWGIPMHTAKPFRSGASLTHWSSEFAFGNQSPEFALGPWALPMNQTLPPISNTNSFPGMSSTYLQSGFGPSVVMALHTLGYTIKGLPSPAPMEARHVTFPALSPLQIGLIAGGSVLGFFLLVGLGWYWKRNR
jgi:hypothetical protein